MNCIFPLIAEICLYFQRVVLEFNAERGTRGQMQRCVLCLSLQGSSEAFNCFI